MSVRPAGPVAATTPETGIIAVKIGGLHIGQITKNRSAYAVLVQRYHKTFNDKQTEIAARILRKFVERLRSSNDVGLGLIWLYSRNSGTLSGGESQPYPSASQIAPA